jgi:hypothetical protein
MAFDPTGPVRTELDRSMNRAAADIMHDQRWAFRMVCRGLTLPFWLPFWWRARRRRRLDFVQFVLHRRDRGILDARRIAVEWAKDRPGEFPFGDYDPALKKLEARVRAILDRPL